MPLGYDELMDNSFVLMSAKMTHMTIFFGHLDFWQYAEDNLNHYIHAVHLRVKNNSNQNTDEAQSVTNPAWGEELLVWLETS